MEDRINLLMSMHNIMLHMNNEDAYWSWVILGVPDQPSRNDYEFIASNEDAFRECVEHFTNVFNEYIEDGIYADARY